MIIENSQCKTCSIKNCSGKELNKLGWHTIKCPFKKIKKIRSITFPCIVKAMAEQGEKNE